MVLIVNSSGWEGEENGKCSLDLLTFNYFLKSTKKFRNRIIYIFLNLICFSSNHQKVINEFQSSLLNSSEKPEGNMEISGHLA